jgi:hypothetical protein
MESFLPPKSGFARRGLVPMMRFPDGIRVAVFAFIEELLQVDRQLAR